MCFLQNAVAHAASQMTQTLQAVRGMHDILPQEIALWRTVEEAFSTLMHSYGYQEVRLPLVEKTELFRRTIGDVTDIVEKEMYTFTDRNGESLSLRPEGTAGCVRAAMEHHLLRGQSPRLWYSGAMFRHERPQKGRYRQFHQLGIEAYGMDGPDIDAELIALSARLWRLLGLGDLKLEINTLGDSAARAAYRGHLIEYFSAHTDALDDDSRRRLHSNPLRLLDSKNPALQTLIAAAPRLTDHLDESSHAHFAGLCDLLDQTGITYKINPRLVRGLDYYGKTVFEWVSAHLGAQGTVCAGGRYDGLVQQLGGTPTAAIGCAMGMERLIALLQEKTSADYHAHAYLANFGVAARQSALAVAERLRDACPPLRLHMDCGGGNLKAQLKRADKSGAAIALILGDEEMQTGHIGIKFLREQGPQRICKQADLLAQLQTTATGAILALFRGIGTTHDHHQT